MFLFSKDDHADHDYNDHGQETTKKTVSDKQETIAAAKLPRCFPQVLANWKQASKALPPGYWRDSDTIEGTTKSLPSKYWQLEDQHESTCPEILARFRQESRP